jgi:CRISPR system Cascade subunit CasD
MSEFLVFTLAAPLASFGELAGNEVRRSTERPGHSLTVGLIGAALGLEREDPRLLYLSQAARIAVALDRVGRPVVDFHTVQSLKASHSRRHEPGTRREALLIGRDHHDALYTTITRREYRTDVLALAALALVGGPFTLSEIAAALKKPIFTLYLGRKCCPLSLPTAPEIINRADPEGAFGRYRELVRSKLKRIERELATPNATVIADARLYGADREGRRQRRRTRPLDRRTWRYGLLDELVLTTQTEGDHGA